MNPRAVGKGSSGGGERSRAVFENCVEIVFSVNGKISHDCFGRFRLFLQEKRPRILR